MTNVFDMVIYDIDLVLDFEDRSTEDRDKGVLTSTLYKNIFISIFMILPLLAKSSDTSFVESPLVMEFKPL